MINVLDEIKLIEETDHFLRFKIVKLPIKKLIDFITTRGENEEFHLVELELLLHSLKIININNQNIRNEISDMIVDLIQDEKYMRIDLDFRQFFKKIQALNKILDEGICISGEITAFKGSLKSEFDLNLC